VPRAAGFGVATGALSRRRFLACAVGAALLTACAKSGPRFVGSDVTGANLGGDLRLFDHTGKARTLADFRGKVVVVFFGYTQCPDVCPTTLAELAQVMKKLGREAADVQVLFVTIDPERDTRELLAQYVPSFDPSFLGLYGDAEATARAAAAFKVLYQKAPGPTPASYTMDHSAGTFLLDREGRMRVYESYGQGADAFEHDIRALLDGA
jgi:protein SCO1/2